MLTRRTPMRRTRIKAVGIRGRQRMVRLADVRPAILSRAGDRCEVPWCRRPVRLDLHHVERRSAGGNDVVTNLVALCRFHHRQVDAPWLRGRLCIVSVGAGDYSGFWFKVLHSKADFLTWETEAHTVALSTDKIRNFTHQGGA